MTTSKKNVLSKVKLVAIGLVVGLTLGIIGTIFFQSFNPADEKQPLSASVVFDRIVQKNELITASQNYNITDKASNANTFFDIFEIPFTENSFWYRYVGTIKAGVNLEDAAYEQNDDTLTITLDEPYIVSNTPDMEKSGVLEENNNILNPIHIEDVDEFQRLCIELSETEVSQGGLLDEARSNAEQDIRDMFNAALGDTYTINFQWRESANE